MGLGLLLFVVVVIVLASLLHHADRKRIRADYENWKNNRS
jgi:hypothetical protein